MLSSSSSLTHINNLPPNRNARSPFPSRSRGWFQAPRPPYVGEARDDNDRSHRSEDREYFYSEMPVVRNSNGQRYHTNKLTDRKILETDILDFWGEGRIMEGNTITGFKEDYSLNHQHGCLQKK